MRLRDRRPPRGLLKVPPSPGSGRVDHTDLRPTRQQILGDRLREEWFEQQRWGKDYQDWHCPRCKCVSKLGETINRKPMPYRCGQCRRHFSVRIGTVMEGSNIGYRK